MPPLEKGKISAIQFMFLLTAYIIPSSIIFTIGIEARQDAWLAVLLGIAFSLGFALLYLVLANRLPGKTLIAINDVVWGPLLGKVFSVVFFLFYMYITFLAINSTVSFQIR